MPHALNNQQLLLSRAKAAVCADQQDRIGAFNDFSKFLEEHSANQPALKEYISKNSESLCGQGAYFIFFTMLEGMLSERETFRKSGKTDNASSEDWFKEIHQKTAALCFLIKEDQVLAEKVRKKNRSLFSISARYAALLERNISDNHQGAQVEERKMVGWRGILDDALKVMDAIITKVPDSLNDVRIKKDKYGKDFMKNALSDVLDVGASYDSKVLQRLNDLGAKPPYLSLSERAALIGVVAVGLMRAVAVPFAVLVKTNFQMKAFRSEMGKYIKGKYSELSVLFIRLNGMSKAESLQERTSAKQSFLHESGGGAIGNQAPDAGETLRFSSNSTDVQNQSVVNSISTLNNSESNVQEVKGENSRKSFG